MDWKSIQQLHKGSYKPSTWKLQDVQAAHQLKSSNELASQRSERELEKMQMKRTVVCSNGKIEYEDYLRDIPSNSLGISTEHAALSVNGKRETESQPGNGDFDAECNRSSATTMVGTSDKLGDNASLASVSEYSVGSGSTITRVSFTPDQRYAIPSTMTYLEALSIASSVGSRAYEYVSSQRHADAEALKHKNMSKTSAQAKSEGVVLKEKSVAQEKKEKKKAEEGLEGNVESKCNQVGNVETSDNLEVETKALAASNLTNVSPESSSTTATNATTSLSTPNRNIESVSQEIELLVAKKLKDESKQFSLVAVSGADASSFFDDSQSISKCSRTESLSGFSSSKPSSEEYSTTTATPPNPWEKRAFGLKSRISLSKDLVTKGGSSSAATQPPLKGSMSNQLVEKSSNSNSTQSPAPSKLSTAGEVMWNNVKVLNNEDALQQRPGYMLDAYGRIIKKRQPTSGAIPDHFCEEKRSSNEPLTPAEIEHMAKVDAAQSLLEVRRQVKWLAMLSQWDVYTTSKSKLLKTRIRKGIPHVFRRAVWQSLLGTQARRIEAGPDFYQSLLKKPLHAHDDAQICRDLPRAHQDYAYFKSPEEGSRTVVCAGQAALFRVLHAYAVYDPHVGYVQGMDGIAGLALMLMSEEEAFYFLERQMIGRGMRQMYVQHMAVAHEYVYIHGRLLRKYLPRLYSFMDGIAKADQEELPTFEYTYCLRWYIKRFGEFAPEFCLRVMDMFLYEGDKALYRVALAVLSLYEPHMRAAQPTDSGDLLSMLNQIASAHDWQIAHLDEIMKVACDFRITRAGIQSLRSEFAKFYEEDKQMGRH